MHSIDEIDHFLQELQQLNLNSEFTQLTSKLIVFIYAEFFAPGYENLSRADKEISISIANDMFKFFENIYEDNADFILLIEKIKKDINNRQSKSLH